MPTTRVTTHTYDFRGRRIATDGELDFYEKTTYDNLDRVTKVERYDTTSSGNLVARSETKYDDRGRVCERIRYGVDPSTGTVGNSLAASQIVCPNLSQDIWPGVPRLLSRFAAFTARPSV